MLRDQGPLIAGGLIGRGFYTADAHPIKIGNENFFDWSADSYRGVSSLNIGHTVVIVGATKKGYCGTKQDLIYFVDLASSNHNVHVMSYKNFCERVSNLKGEIKEGQSTRLDIRSPYLLSHPQLKPNLAKQKAKDTASFWSETCSVKNVGALATAALIAGAVAYGLLS